MSIAADTGSAVILVQKRVVHMTIALVIIDIQNDYFTGGKMPLEGSLVASEHVKRLLDFFRSKHLPIVHIQHIATRPGATFFLPNTPGLQIHANVQPLEGETVFQKHYPNSFRDTPLLDHLRQLGIARVVVAGMMTHMCVDATVRAATDYGFACFIAQDACATHALNFQNDTVPATHVHHAFLAALDGSYGKVLTTDAILAQLQSE
jgi:nicotinamidase-related amidase